MSISATARVGACVLVLLLLGPRARADDETEAGRDFPKTLTLDEPGIDDEMSLPTFTRIHREGTARAGDGGTATALDFEIDKRVTDRLDVQLTGGWTDDGHGRDGWQDFGLTSKYVVLDQPRTETLLTLGLTRSFGATGALRVGATSVSSTAPTLYAGQGFGASGLAAPLRPFAVTASLGYLVPDRAHDAGGADMPQQLQIGASLQYDLHGLAPDLAAAHLIPLVEFTYAQPTTASRGSDARQGYVAPGLIYAGDGYQLAAEALLPLTRATGSRPGLIAQLNVSFRTLGLDRFAGPLF